MHNNSATAAHKRKRSFWTTLQMPVIHILILALVALIAYSNTFHVPFVFDDEGSIQLHKPVHGLANYLKDWAGYNYLPNRAFGYLTFAINYEFGGLNPAGYHLVNLAIHIITALLVYAMVRLTFRTPRLQGSDDDSSQTRVFAFVVALLFVCHPLQTQAVTYIVQRLTSLTTLLYLAALASYAHWRLSSTNAAANSTGDGLAWYILSLTATVLAMKTKEISFTLPVMILLYESSFFGFPGRRLMMKLTPLLLTIVIIPVTMFLRLSPVIQASDNGGSFLSDVNTPAYNIVKMTRWDYLFTQFNVIVTYLRLLFFPVNQNLDYDYPINRTLLAPRPFLALLLLLSIILLAFRMFLRSRQNAERQVQGEHSAVPLPFASSQLLLLASFGIFWFFITLSVESSVIVIQDVIYEHRVYLPSFGFFLALTSLGTLGMTRLEKRFHGVRMLACAVVACIVVILSGLSYSRNNVWQDWISLWSDTVAKSPAKPRPHNVLGIGYYYLGKYNEAMQEYKEAVRLKPGFIEAYYNMALVHNTKKEYQEAINMYVKALGLSAFNATQQARAYNEIGINYAELGNPDQAVMAFASAVNYEPESIEYRTNYAFALSTTGKRDEAVRQYRKVLQLDPGNSYAMQALQNMNTPKKPDGT